MISLAYCLKNFLSYFFRSFKFLATGTKSGLLTIWDYSTHAERVRCQHTVCSSETVVHFGDHCFMVSGCYHLKEAKN